MVEIQEFMNITGHAQTRSAAAAASRLPGIRHGDTLELQSLRKEFHGVPVVADVDLQIAPGEFLTLLGPSGCGKTTLLRMIAGFERPTGGRIMLGGHDVTTVPAEGRPLNMVFQRYALFPHLSVAQNVAYGLRNQGVKGTALQQRVSRVLDQVDLADLATRKVTELSGGQCQRVALARAVVNEPNVLLLDEPLGALDLQLRKRMQVELRALQKRLGMTFVYVTHDQEEALAMSDRVAVMGAGRIDQLGTPEQIYRRPATRYVASFVGEATLFDASIGGVAGSGFDVVLDVGVLPIRAGADGNRAWHAGDRTVMVVRPEHMSVVRSGQGKINGVVVDVMFLGAQHRHLVQLADGTFAKADMPEVVSEIGREVGLEWATNAGVLVSP